MTQYPIIIPLFSDSGDMSELLQLPGWLQTILTIAFGAMLLGLTTTFIGTVLYVVFDVDAEKLIKTGFIFMLIGVVLILICIPLMLIS